MERAASIQEGWCWRNYQNQELRHQGFLHCAQKIEWEVMKWGLGLMKKTHERENEKQRTGEKKKQEKKWKYFRCAVQRNTHTPWWVMRASTWKVRKLHHNGDIWKSWNWDRSLSLALSLSLSLCLSLSFFYFSSSSKYLQPRENCFLVWSITEMSRWIYDSILRLIFKELLFFSLCSELQQMNMPGLSAQD